MKTETAKRWGFQGAALALVATLAACGGGGGGSSGGFVPLGLGGSASTGSGNGSGDAAPQVAQVSGVAAVGSPLVGTVTVKDALGATRTVPIGVNGAYSVDVSGMTAPFVFRAEGSVNGTLAVVHSIATQADINGRINITQLTDLIVSNIAGQLAQTYFDKFAQDSNADLATQSLVDAEVAKLREKLLPVLSALGVDAAIDLLHSAFTPLSDPLDKALDIIRVSYDTAANTATISNVLNAVTVVDDLSVKAGAETAPAVLSADNVVSGATDLERVKQVLKDFTAKFANGLPSSGDLSPLMTNGFLWNDQNLSASIAFFTQASAFVGGAFTDVEIDQIDYSDPTRVTAHLSFSAKTPQGIELGRLENWRVRKGPDGVWRLHGDQRVLALETFAVTSEHHALADASVCVRTGLEFNIENPDTSDDGGTAAYAIVTGPGLPTGGVRYEPPSLGGRWLIPGAGIETYWLDTSCPNAPATPGEAAITAIPDNAQYTVTAYDAGGTRITFPSGTSDGSYRLKIQRRPLTLAEAGAAGTFPVIASATTQALAGYQSGALAFSSSGINPLAQAYVQMRRYASGGASVDGLEKDVLPSTTGTVETSLTFPADPTVVSMTMWVESIDRYRRNIQTYFQK